MRMPRALPQIGAETRGGRDHGGALRPHYIFFSSLPALSSLFSATTFPPLSVQSLSLFTIVLPWPLQEFFPLPAVLSPPLQALFPLHELMPEHLTVLPPALSPLSASADDPAKNEASAVAI